MILPIRTSVIPRKTPYANYLIIGLNILFFALSYGPHYVGTRYRPIYEPLREWAQQFILSANNPEIWQFVSYAFLHASFAHIIGNMFFLYIFGNNVNDRLGNVGYICFYLAGGIAAGIGHTILSNNPVLGASGAVAAVTGAFLVLYPKALITVLYWMFFIGTFEVPAIWFIAIKLIIIDNFPLFNPNYHNAPVAYDAHLTGYGFGMATVAVLLWTKILKSENFDLVTIIRQWYRRKVYQSVVNDSYDPFTGMTTKTARTAEVKKTDSKKEEKKQKILKMREDISRSFGLHDISTATQTYLKMMTVDSSQVMAKQQQLDIANHLMSIGSWENSAKAYEKFKLHYPKYEHIEQIKLMLGILYSRYLLKPDQAIENLEQALEKLTDEGQIELCQQELEKNKRDY